MVRRAQKESMKRFVAERIEESRRYNIVNFNDLGILIEVIRNDDQPPTKREVVTHYSKMTLVDYASLLEQLRRQDIQVANIFYKDGNTFHVRLAGRGKMKGDSRSLKKYDKKTIDSMIHLRGLEKAVLENQSEPTLVYYQPRTERLEEALRWYAMGDVELDYSHIGPEDRAYGFVESSTSIDYKIANETQNTRRGIVFRRNGNLWMPRSVEEKKE